MLVATKEDYMISKKADMPQISFRPSEKLRRDFKIKCVKLAFTQDEVLISLISMWERNKIKIPAEG